MTNESHLFSWCNNPWYRELIAAHLTPVILSLFRLWLVLPSSPRCLWLVTITLLSLSLVTMADKESRIFEGAIDQKLNSIANIPSAISDLIFGDESIFFTPALSHDQDSKKGTNKWSMYFEPFRPTGTGKYCQNLKTWGKTDFLPQKWVKNTLKWA